MTEILENIINKSNNINSKNIYTLFNKDMSNHEFKRFIFNEIRKFAENVENEDIVKIYASALIEKYIEELVEKRINKALFKII